MEQKQTINFGAGPAKLPQSVSSDPHLACVTLITCGNALKRRPGFGGYTTGKRNVTFTERYLHAAGVSLICKSHIFNDLNIQNSTSDAFTASVPALRHLISREADNDCCFQRCCLLPQAEDRASCISLHSFMCKPAPLCFTGSSTGRLSTGGPRPTSRPPKLGIQPEEYY